VTRRLPPFFSNLLPEGHLRSYLAQKADVNPEREFFLMAMLGGDVAGAVTVKPFGGTDEVDDDNVVVDEGHHEGKGSGERADVLRFSLAGVQLKFSAILESSGGLTIPAHGVGGSWIVKLPSTQFDAVPENEYVMLALARAVGIETPASRLVPVAAIEGLPEDAARIKGMALAVQRFDRGPGGKRIHMEDFAQVFGAFPEAKYKKRSYANIASVLWAECGDASTYEFVRRLVFSTLIGNADMHLKNWSLIYHDRRTPSLSPAYDLVSTIPYIADDEAALTFARTRRFDGFTLDELSYLAGKAGLPATSGRPKRHICRKPPT
jgi:serine/threonine-protein kinase HipA